MALDNLPNPSWSVVFGEVPSASKWSELGENDDSLATGAGWDDEIVEARHYKAGDAGDDVWRNGAAFIVTKNTSQSISGSGSVVTWQEVQIDVGNNFDLANNRFVVPYSGLYSFSAQIGDASSSSRKLASFQVNGSDTTRAARQADIEDCRVLNFSRILNLSEGDNVRVEALFVGGSPSTANRSEFSGHLITRT